MWTCHMDCHIRQICHITFFQPKCAQSPNRSNQPKTQPKTQPELTQISKIRSDQKENLISPFLLFPSPISINLCNLRFGCGAIPTKRVSSMGKVPPFPNSSNHRSTQLR
ncbi:hypothetical protein LINPERHAP1_LOCUS17166 [Linum perenne]